jgi:hypothetical protein
LITTAIQLVVACPWIGTHYIQSLRRAYPSLRLGSPFGCYDIDPLAPTISRRYKGFGRRSNQRSASHVLPSYKIICHYAWYCLDPASRFSIVRACAVMVPYAFLRRYAGTHRHGIRSSLTRARASPKSETGHYRHRTRDMGAALLLFDCCCGDLIRWLEGEYTNKHCNWSDLFQV